MCDINLKHYSAYLRKLNNYANALGIKIKYNDIDGEGSYSPTRKRVNIDPELSQSAEIATLLHELGHASDETVTGPNCDPFLERAYKHVYAGTYSTKHIKAVLKCEKRAWNYGRTIAKLLRIRLGKWYTDTENFCLDDYRRRESV